MSAYPTLLQELIDAFNHLPGIGKRSAERIALFLIESQKGEAEHLSQVVAEAKRRIVSCPICNSFSDDGALCGICSDGRRDKAQVCIVEYPKDTVAIEKTGAYHGVYFVLLGEIAPIDGRGPHHLDIGKLIARVAAGEVQEVIIATDADADGESTAMFLKSALSAFPVSVTRIGIGIPLGTQVEFADPATLAKSMSDRRAR